MRLLIASLVALGSFSIAQADDTAGLAEAKKGMSENIEGRIKILNEVKSCIDAATTKDDLKKCHEMAKEDRLQRREKMLEGRKERIEKRMKKLEEEKAKSEPKK